MTDADEPRDPELRALLEVEPLDDVTRARLVRTAVKARSHRRPWLVGAAAAAAILVVAIAIALARQGADSTPTAERPATPSHSAPGDKATSGADSGTAPASAPNAASAQARAAAPAALAALGDVTKAAALRTTAAGAPPLSAAALPACVLDAVRTSGDPVAAGTATFHGEPVTVVVVQRPAGGRSAVVVGSDCRVIERVRL